MKRCIETGSRGNLSITKRFRCGGMMPIKTWLAAAVISFWCVEAQAADRSIDQLR